MKPALLGFEFVTDAIDGLDAPTEPCGIQLRADALDMRINCSGFTRKIIAPNAG